LKMEVGQERRKFQAPWGPVWAWFGHEVDELQY
jgi:hypothetical protein